MKKRMEKMAKKKELKKTEVAVPIDWSVSDNIVARYATNMVVQRLENEFVISFFEIMPPIFLGDPEYIAEKLENLKSAQANCVAQVIVAHNKLPAFIDALKKNHDSVFENMEAEE